MKQMFKQFEDVARYYAPTLRLQVYLFPAISLVVGISSYLGSFSPAGMILSSLLSITVSLMLMFGPMIFMRHSNRVLEIMLPVTAAAKWLFVVCWCIIIIPAMTLGVNYATTELLGRIFGVGPYCPQYIAKTLNLQMAWYQPAVSYFSSMVPVVTCMYCVEAIRRNRAMTIVWTIFSVVATGILGAIWGMAIAYNNKTMISTANGDVIDPNALAEEMTRSMIGTVWIVGVVAMLYFALMLCLTWRKMHKMQY